MSSPSYLGVKLAPIWTVLAGSSVSICTTIASSATLKTPDEGGMAKSGSTEVAWRLISLYSAMMTVMTISSMLSYLQFSVC
jgi:hypothetical protein